MKNCRNKFVLVLVVPALVIAIVALNQIYHRIQERKEQLLTPEELGQLASTLGIIFPESTSSIRIFAEIDDQDICFLLRCTFDPDDVAQPEHAAWLLPTSEVTSLGFNERPYLAPAWYDAAPVQDNDLRFIKDITFQNVSTTVYGLVRVTDETAILYLDGMARKGMFPPPFVAALREYPRDPSGTVLGPTGLFYERRWTGDGLPAEVTQSVVPPVSSREVTEDFGDWSTDPAELHLEPLGQIDSCLWQSGTRHVKQTGYAESTLLYMRGYVVLKQADVERLLKELKWVPISEAEFTPVGHPDAPKMESPLLRSSELIERLGRKFPFATIGDAVLAIDTGTIYIEFDEAERK